MKSLKKYKSELIFLLAIIVVGQILFTVFSSAYTKPRYESRIFATTGIVFDGSDLHKLNEAAHYFGQTMIGWTKFPSFKDQLAYNVRLPKPFEVNMHMQERQNIIFTVRTNEPVMLEDLRLVKGFLQDKINEYNEKTNTEFVLTNVDYEQAEIRRSYGFGQLVTLLLSVVVGIGLLFIRKEFFPPKLKL